MSLLPATTVSVMGCSEGFVVATPQIPFRVMFLYIPESHAIDFEITSIRVGRFELLTGIGGVPAEFFSMVSEEHWKGVIIEEFRKSGRLSALIESMKIAYNEIATHEKPVTVRFRNLNPSSRNFRCVVLGDEVREEQPQPQQTLPALFIANDSTLKAPPTEHGKPICYGCGTKAVPAAGEICKSCRL
jgi:hypothetical protein